ncbi:uncharacterized protein DS421_6g195550 [Arachis hypogaea]|nr:uncharacterized protein DS421_6g195550 [Arachis hypogaea]
MVISGRHLNEKTFSICNLHMIDKPILLIRSRDNLFEGWFLRIYCELILWLLLFSSSRIFPRYQGFVIAGFLFRIIVLNLVSDCLKKLTNQIVLSKPSLTKHLGSKKPSPGRVVL